MEDEKEEKKEEVEEKEEKKEKESNSKEGKIQIVQIEEKENDFGEAFLLLNTFGVIDIDKLKELLNGTGLIPKLYNEGQFKDFLIIYFKLKNNITFDLESVKSILLEKLKFAISDNENRENIKNVIKKSPIFEHLVKVTKSVYSSIKKNKLSKLEIKNFFNERYGGLFSEEIISYIVDILTTDKEQLILDKYSLIQESLLEYYYLEFIAYEQLSNFSLFFIIPKEEYFNPHEKKLYYEKIKIQGLNELNFKWEDLFIPLLQGHSNILISEKRKDIIILPNISDRYNKLTSAIITLICGKSSNLKFLNFTLEKQRFLMDSEISRIELDLEAAKNTLDSYSIKNLEDLKSRINEFVNLIRENYSITIQPIEDLLKILIGKGNEMGNQIIKEFFGRTMFINQREIFEPRDWIKNYFPDKVIKEMNQNINEIRSFYKKYMSLCGDLKIILEGMITAKKGENLEQIEKYGKLIVGLLGKFLSSYKGD